MNHPCILRVDRKPQPTVVAAPFSSAGPHVAGVRPRMSNQALQSRAFNGVLQQKVTINPPSDICKQEADRVADAVMRMRSTATIAHAPLLTGIGAVQRDCEECKPKAKTMQRMSPVDAQSQAAPQVVNEVLRSPGQPLDRATRSFMEPRFGADFSNVRVHTDATAADSATAMNALAYTVTDHIVFASGRYSPKEGAGRRLLAHELAHVRQRAGSFIPRDRLQRAPNEEKPKAEESDCTPSPETYDKVRAFDKDNVALGLTQPHIEFDWNPQFTKGKCSVKVSKAKLSFKPFVFTKEGTYVFGPAVDKSGTCKGKLDHILKITGPMAERIKQGEREHCEDVRLAFNLSYQKYSKACEDLGAGFSAANATECRQQVLVRLKDAVGIDPSQWTKVANCLVDKTIGRDTKGWHTAGLTGSFDKDCKHFTSTPDPIKSLPEVGKHLSSELVKGCGE